MTFILTEHSSKYLHGNKTSEEDRTPIDKTRNYSLKPFILGTAGLIAAGLIIGGSIIAYNHSQNRTPTQIPATTRTQTRGLSIKTKTPHKTQTPPTKQKTTLEKLLASGKELSPKKSFMYDIDGDGIIDEIIFNGRTYEIPLLNFFTILTNELENANKNNRHYLGNPNEILNLFEKYHEKIDFKNTFGDERENWQEFKTRLKEELIKQRQIYSSEIQTPKGIHFKDYAFKDFIALDFNGNNYREGIKIKDGYAYLPQETIKYLINKK